MLRFIMNILWKGNADLHLKTGENKLRINTCCREKTQLLLAP